MKKENLLEIPHHSHFANYRDGGSVEFNISENGEDFVNLASCYLHVKVKTTKSDGTSLLAAEPITPVNLLLQTLFSQVDVKVCKSE